MLSALIIYEKVISVNGKQLRVVETCIEGDSAKGTVDGALAHVMHELLTQRELAGLA